MAFTFKTLIVPFLAQYFRHNMFAVIGWEDYVIWLSSMMIILLLYHITINVLKSFQIVYLTLHYHSGYVFCGTSLAYHQKGRVSSIYSSTLMHQQDLCKKMISGKYMPPEGWRHHYDHQLSSVIKVCIDSRHQAQLMNQSFVAVINAATSYKPIVNLLWLARLYNHILSGLTLPPDCFLSRMLACISIIMVFTAIIITKCIQHWLSRQHVATKKMPEHHTGKPTKMRKPTKMIFTRQGIKFDTKGDNPICPLCHQCI